MKNAKRGFLVVLSIKLIMAYAGSVYATARWDYLITLGSNLAFEGDYATADIVCSADAIDVDKITAKCKLQQFKGDDWKTVKTWSESRDGSMIRYSKSYPVARNYSYQLKVTATVYKDSMMLEQIVDEGPYEFFQ